MATCAGTNEVAVPDFISYPGYTGDYPGFTLVLDDRFDHFNTEVWQKGDGAVGSEAACRFQDQGVLIREGKLDLVVQKEFVRASWSDDHQQTKGDYQYSCGELRTRPDRRIRYGRLEARMKAPARQSASGYISSLFTYVNEENDANIKEWEEIDVELEGLRPDKFQANLIYGINAWAWWSTRDYGAWEDKITVGPVDEWRVFAIEWLPNELNWYVDGRLAKKLKQSDINCVPGCSPPQKHATPIPDDFADLMVNFWIPNDTIQDTFGGNKERNTYPMITQYDWIRYYQYDEAPATNWRSQ